MPYELALFRAFDDAFFLFTMAYLACIIVGLVGMWKTFEKANQPGWGSIIPIYNVVLMLKIAGKPLWWLILLFLPFIGILPIILVSLGVAKSFRKGVGFGLGVLFLPFIFYPILGFGDAEFDPDVPVF